MSRNTSNGSDANDGNWFLEAVGAKPKTPSPSEAVAELTAENTLPDLPAIPSEERQVEVVAAVTAFDGDTGTSTSSFHPVPAAPPPPPLDIVADETDELEVIPVIAAPSTEVPPPPAEAPAPPAAIPAAAVASTTATPPAPPPRTTPRSATAPIADEDLPRALRSRRNFRWPIVITLVVLIAAIGAAAWWLPQKADQDALAVRQDYYDAAAGVRNYLPDAQGALDVITNPASGSDAISGAVPVIAELDTRAFTLETVTAEPLPSVLPLVPSSAIDALVPLRETGALLGGASSDLARRLGDAYVYRTSTPLLLDSGNLPIVASTQEINAISVTLASSLAADAGIVADLPDDPAFADVRVAAVAAVDRYASWQEEYLAALAAEDPDTASALLDELDAIRNDLDAVTEEAILAFRVEADQQIVDLAGDLEAYMDVLAAG